MKFKQALLKNRGGLKTASDADLLAIWQRLDKKTQADYLKTVEAKDAVSDKSKQQV